MLSTLINNTYPLNNKMFGGTTGSNTGAWLKFGVNVE